MPVLERVRQLSLRSGETSLCRRLLLLVKRVYAHFHARRFAVTAAMDSMARFDNVVLVREGASRNLADSSVVLEIARASTGQTLLMGCGPCLPGLCSCPC